MNPGCILKCILQFLGVLAVSSALEANCSMHFPDCFIFGVGTSAYQIEGAWNEDGKGESIIDRMMHEHPEYTEKEENGDVACDSYHKYKEDVKMLENLGVSFYRFSISWPRVLPTGEANNINQAGIKYYNALIDKLIQNGIEPMVTMYHWDLPQWLQDLGGWTNPIIADYFEDYARILYENFGDRVKWWITINEPTSLLLGYTTAKFLAPSLNKTEVRYLVTHNLLISHARAYHLYDKEYRPSQKGKMSITIQSFWYEPKTNSTEDVAAADVGLQFDLGIFAHPIYSTEGDYPSVVRKRVDKNSKAEGRMRSRLPVFSPKMKEYVRGTYDFFGLNYYTTLLISNGQQSKMDLFSSYIAQDADVSHSVDPTWPIGQSWLSVVPFGLRKLMHYIHQNYNAPPIIITENGFSDLPGTINDTGRINFYKKHLAEVLKSIHLDGVNVTGFTAWSLMDNFEWMSGYEVRFGLYYVNFTDPKRPRTPKASAQFYKDLTKSRTLRQ